jgi:hypothetical protein
MRKPFLSIISIFLFPIVFIFVGCGGEDLDGVYYISDEAVAYQFDTLDSFKMIDNHGITEQFYVDDFIWYPTHHQFEQFNGIFLETFGIAYHSVLNDYFFFYLLRGEIDYTALRVEWNQKDVLIYNFDEHKITSTGIIPTIQFYDSLLIGGLKYNDIIEIDYTGNMDYIDANTPVKTYISGEKGLIKFIRKDGIIYERIPD